MAVDPITGTSTDYPTPSADMVSTQDASLGKTDFLKMLVAQMTSQDPMNPMEGTEFATQLAQFTSVQELQKMSDTLDSSLQSNLLLTQSINNSTATTLIGKSVRANVDTISVGSAGDSTLYYDLSGAATQISVEVKDSSGNVVRTMTVNPQEAGDHSVTWDGKDDNGIRVPEGNYTYAVTATGADGSSVDATTIISGVVTSVSYENGSAELLLGDIRVQLGQVLTIGSGSSGAKKG